MKYPLRWVALGVGVVAIVFAVILAVNVGTDPNTELNTSRLLGKPAPDVELTRLDGTKVTSADLAGKTVIVNFWNSWCIPCEQELPVIRQWYRQHSTDSDLVVLGIPRDDAPADIRSTALRDGMDWAVANDGGAKAATLDFATRGQPETFAISPRGIVSASVIGPVTAGQLDKMVRISQAAA